MGKKYDIVAKKESHENGSIPIDASKEALSEAGFDLTKPMEFSDKVAIKELGLMVQAYNKKTNEKQNKQQFEFKKHRV